MISPMIYKSTRERMMLFAKKVGLGVVLPFAQPRKAAMPPARAVRALKHYPHSYPCPQDVEGMRAAILQEVSPDQLPVEYGGTST